MFKVQNISFAYGSEKVLSGASFSAASGAVIALTGVNGAGKTTLMRILAGLMLPSGGAVLADGTDVFAEPLAYRRHMGWLGENSPADDDLTVKHYLTYRARLKGEQSRKIRHRVEEAMSECTLENVQNVRIGELSNGKRKLTALAEAMLLRPRYLILDDVFAGLDRESRDTVCGLIKGFPLFATTIIAGHETDIFTEVANEVLRLEDGRIA